MTKRKEIITMQNSNNYTEILFGEKPTTATLWDGCWNPTYRHKKLSKNSSYYPVLKIIHPNEKIIDIDIIFRSKYPKYKQNLNTQCYNWVNPHFWIKTGFYPKLKYRRIYDAFYNYKPKKLENFLKKPPIEEDFEIIFDGIWQICVTKEGITSISRSTFNGYIWLIRFLIENTVVFPIEEINNYELWEKHIHNYLEETGCLFGDVKNGFDLLKGWHVTKDTTPEKMQNILILDIKTILNLFFEKIKPDGGLGIFLYKVYESYANELIKMGYFIKCLHCGLLADYLKGKKYCSLGPDGRDCGKQARNKKYYQTRGKKRLPRYRKATRELRAFYKEKGVKK